MDALSRKVAWQFDMVRYLRKVLTSKGPTVILQILVILCLSTVPLHDLCQGDIVPRGYGTNFSRITSRSSFVKWTLLFSTLIALDTRVWAARVSLTCSSNSMANFEKFAVWERTLERASASVISLIDAINTVQTKNRIDSATTQGLWRNVFCM